MYEHPTSGSVQVLDGRLGSVDVRRLRRSVALVSPALIDMVRPGLSAHDLVMSAKYAALEPWWHSYDRADSDRANDLLDAQGVGFAAQRSFGSLSSGEKQRVLLARALMGAPGVILLDEPCTGLDLRAREDLVARLSEMATDPTTPPMVLVTHHVEEIPSAFTHLMLMRDGQIIAQGPLGTTLTEDSLGETFGIPLTLDRYEDGRWSARAA